MTPHDHAYKALFSHPEMVRDLLDGFVCGKWLADVDYASLEKVNSSYVTEDLRGRADDLVWRVRWGAEWVYIYLLMEFQSSIDAYMAVRMFAYVALLHQDLIKTNQTAQGMLPPVLPLVLYNGSVPWCAKQDVSELIAPGPIAIAEYQPSLRYLLIDEKRYRESDLAPMQNLAAALFRLERGESDVAISDVVAKLLEWLQSPEHSSLRRTFEIWLNRVVLPRFTSVNDNTVRELHEVRMMLDENIAKWKRGWRQEGLEEGRLEGRREGWREGAVRILTRQLEARFGQLPMESRMRVEQANLAMLDHWGERLLTVDTLEALFSDEDMASDARGTT